MKTISTGLAARIDSGVLTTCLCWKLARVDGIIVGLTDHDADVDYSGLTYRPGAAVEAGRFEQAGGLRPGRAAVSGALSSEAFTDEDLELGLWTGARVSVFRVDWQTGDGVLVWTGYIADLSRSEAGFEADLISRKADLEKPVGRVFSRLCDAKLGDARCGLSDVEGQSCDKAFETCRTAFSNASNFRGFPHMPGPDFLLSGPSAGRNDGGRR